ncbi:MAG: hypothetical protein KC547_01625 [Anaerolineae bacterium]|nr:hypothetical protein [Anaerolineae bacterium]MCA9909537.1 hypothetical protein [Anaerolineae bacterium]
MSVHYETLGQGIILVKYTDPLTIVEIADAVEAFQQIADEFGFDRYVTINDFTESKRFPSDLSNVQRLAAQDKRAVGAVVVKAPLFTQIVGRMVSRMTSLIVVNSDSLKDGQIIAQRILAGEPIRSEV